MPTPHSRWENRGPESHSTPSRLLGVDLCPLTKILFFFFTVDHFKVFIESGARLHLFYVSVCWPRGMWDLSFLTRDWTYTPCTGSRSLNHRITRAASPLDKILISATQSVCFTLLWDVWWSSQHQILWPAFLSCKPCGPYLLPTPTPARYSSFSQPLLPCHRFPSLSPSSLAALRGLCACSSLIRDWTRATAVKEKSPSHWTTRELPRFPSWRMFFSGP